MQVPVFHRVAGDAYRHSLELFRSGELIPMVRIPFMVQNVLVEGNDTDHEDHAAEVDLSYMHENMDKAELKPGTSSASKPACATLGQGCPLNGSLLESLRNARILT